MKVTKASGYVLMSQEAVAEADEFRAALARVLDPNYIPPPPWEGPPITPVPTAYTQLLAVFDPIVHELVEMHGPKPNHIRHDGSCDWQCEGCPVDMESGYPDWPCETTAVIARHLGVEL